MMVGPTDNFERVFPFIQVTIGLGLQDRRDLGSGEWR